MSIFMVPLLRVLCDRAVGEKKHGSIMNGIFLNYCFLLPSQFVMVFTLSDLLDKPWSQVTSLLLPDTCLHFYRTQGSANSHLSAFYARANSHFLRAFRSSIIMQEKVPVSASMHSGRLEPASLIFVGRFICYTTGEARYTTLHYAI